MENETINSAVIRFEQRVGEYERLLGDREATKKSIAVLNRRLALLRQLLELEKELHAS